MLITCILRHWNDVKPSPSRALRCEPKYGFPKTFQDAITVTRALGIRYLRIGSLCIVQDDPLDWASESSRMADVYNYAFLTIAAAYSSDSYSGFLKGRWH